MAAISLVSTVLGSIILVFFLDGTRRALQSVYLKDETNDETDTIWQSMLAVLLLFVPDFLTLIGIPMSDELRKELAVIVQLLIGARVTMYIGRKTQTIISCCHAHRECIAGVQKGPQNEPEK
jgi:hypothetical protein